MWSWINNRILVIVVFFFAVVAIGITVYFTQWGKRKNSKDEDPPTGGGGTSPVSARTKYIRSIRVRGSTTGGSYDVYAKISGSKKNIVSSSNKNRRSETNIPINPGETLEFKYDLITTNIYNPTTTTLKTISYDDLDESVCWDANKDGVDIMDCSSEIEPYQPPGPTTDCRKLPKCPIDMPDIYYANRDKKDQSVLYYLDNWPDCNGAVKYFMNQKGVNIGEAYDLVLSEVTNNPNCKNA